MTVHGCHANAEVARIGFTEFGNVSRHFAMVHLFVLLIDRVNNLLDLRCAVRDCTTGEPFVSQFRGVPFALHKWHSPPLDLMLSCVLLRDVGGAEPWLSWEFAV